MITRDAIVTQARTYIDLKWQHQARGPLALDCIGLLVVTARELGTPVVDRTDYPRHPNGPEFLRHLKAQFPPAASKTPRPGSIGCFREKRYVCHTGIFSMKDGVLHLIHAYAHERAVIEEPYLYDRAELLIDVLDFPGVQD